MKKIIYIHGLGGSGNGSSARNIKKALDGKCEFFAGTYDLLTPEKAFGQIKNDIQDKDIVIASSLGAFYAACLTECKTMLLLNPCLEPEKSISKILYPEQRKDFDEAKCNGEWLELKKNWEKLDEEKKGLRFGVFSDKDELFSFLDTFKKNFGMKSNLPNSAMISGTHEIAKDESQLSAALALFWEYNKE